MNSKRDKGRLTVILLAALLIMAAMLPGCSGPGGAEIKVSEDLESMRFVELDPLVNAELENLLSDQGKEYYEMFLGKAGEFDYEITGSEQSEDATVVNVRITTYDFASEYLKSWTEFLQKYGIDETAAADGKAPDYDSAELYETLFRNLSSIQNKDYTAVVSITCAQDEDGEWHTDAETNTALRDAILGGMINEMSSLAGL